jgi:antitoxin component of MazEF toxin-antitoxin module
MVQGIITKTGNSYAIRVPKRYIDDNKLKLGDVVDVEEPLIKQRQALDALIKHGKRHVSINGISDPVAWQREERAWEDRRENTDK